MGPLLAALLLLAPASSGMELPVPPRWPAVDADPEGALDPDSVSERTSWFQASATMHYGFVPSSLLDAWFDVHGDIEGVGPGVEVGWKKHGFNAFATWEMIFITMPAQIWLEKDADPSAAVWVEHDLRFMALSVNFAYEATVWGPFSIMPCIGWGPVYRQGDIIQYHTVDDPDVPLSEREPIPNLDGEVLILPRRFLNGDLSLRARYRPSERLFFSADFGYRLYLFMGISGGIKL